MSAPKLKVPGKAKGFSKVEIALDKGDDFAEDKITMSRSLISSAKPIISAACNAMANAQGSSFEAQTAQDLLEPVKKVMDALTVLGQVHPFIGVVVVAASALVSFELKRRDNDKKIAALLLKQSDTMLVLLQLNDIQDPSIPGLNGETIQGRLQSVFGKVKAAIAKCGNAIDTYHKQQFIVKFFKSPSWQDTFVGVADEFDRCKSDLQYALSIHMASTLDAAANRLNQVDIKVTALLDIFKHQSDLDKEMSVEVARRGGNEKCLASDDSLNELLPIARRADDSSISGTDSSVDSTLMFTLRSSLEDLLKNNEPIFESKLNVQTRLLQDTIKSSEDRILRALGGGDFYKRIIHNDVRLVWKAMGWRSSADAHNVVFSIHDFYIDRIRFGLNPGAGSPYFSAKKASGDGGVSPTGSIATEDPAEDAAEILKDLQRAQEDKWCIEYLKTYYVPAISEVMDDDLSGFIKISEVNEFTEFRPEGWSLLNWLSFWSVGWQLANTWYHARIESLLDRMHHLIVLQENSEFVDRYLDSSGIFVPTIISRANRPVCTPGTVEIVGLVRKWMDSVEEKLEATLKELHYEIDAPDTLALLLETPRIERFLLPFYYLILRRHHQVLKLCAKIVVDDKELPAMRLTLKHIVNAVISRTDQLKDCFYAQRLNVEDSFEHFANGLYTQSWGGKNFVTWNDSGFNPSFCRPWSGPTDEFKETTTAHIDKEEVDLAISELKFPLPQPFEVSSTASDGSMSKLRRYMYLYDRKLNVVSYADDDRVVFTVEDEKELDEMEASLSAEDVEKFRRLAMEERRLVPRHGIMCSFCRTGMPIVGTRIKCLDCEAKALCSSCQANPAKYDNEHQLQHNILEFPRSTSNVAAFRFVEQGRNLAVKVARSAGDLSEPAVLIACLECPYRARALSGKEITDVESAGHSPRHVVVRVRSLFGKDLYRVDQASVDDPPSDAADPAPNLGPDSGEMVVDESRDADRVGDLGAGMSERITGLEERMARLEKSVDDRLAKLEGLLQALVQKL